MQHSEPTKSVLIEHEIREFRLRMGAVRRSVSYLEDRKNRSLSEGNLFIRRQNNSSQLSVYQIASNGELQMINLHALPRKDTLPRTRNFFSLRYMFQTNKRSKNTRQQKFIKK